MSPSRRPRLTKQVRIKVALLLTREEIDRLEARAAGEVRSVGNYVAWVIEQHLAKKPGKGRKPRDADPREERTSYDVGPFLTIPQRRELEKRVDAERRSVSSYVTRLVLDALDAQGSMEAAQLVGEVLESPDQIASRIRANLARLEAVSPSRFSELTGIGERRLRECRQGVRKPSSGRSEWIADALRRFPLDF